MPEVTKHGVFDCQVCVPKDWTDQQVIDFADLKNPTGISSSWFIRKKGNKSLAGDPERRQCEEYKDRCHIMLEC